MSEINTEALGMIETRGFTAMVEASGCHGKSSKSRIDRLRKNRRRFCDRYRSR